MPFDRWGLPFFYPSKPSGFFWQQKDDIKDDSHYESEEVTTSGGGSFTIHFQGPTAGTIYTDRAFENTNSIGGCNMDFPATASRGYIYKPNDPRDIEIKFIVNFGSGFSSNGFSVSGPTGLHSGSNCCSGFAYMFNMEPGTNPTDFRFRKEMWHVSYHTDPKTGDWNHSKANFKLIGRNVGIGYVRYNKKDGISKGKDSVVLEGWFNPDPDDDPTNWIMLKRTEDKGGWGNDGDDCGGAKDQVGTWGGPKYRMKSNADDATATFKHLSFREIDPLLSFDDNPDVPEPPSGGGGGDPVPTSTILGTFRFSQDVNTIRSGECAGTGTGSTPDVPGGGGPEEVGNTIFYDDTDTNSTTELSNTSTFQNRTRGGEQCDNSSSRMRDKVIKQLDVYLAKVGSPAASPTVRAKIWSSGGSVRYTSPTSLDPSTLSTSFTKKIFDFSTNTVSINTGDVVGVEYITTSSSDYVLFAYSDDIINNCTYVNYENGALDPKPTTRDFCCRMWE